MSKEKLAVVRFKVASICFEFRFKLMVVLAFRTTHCRTRGAFAAAPLTSHRILRTIKRRLRRTGVSSFWRPELHFVESMENSDEHEEELLEFVHSVVKLAYSLKCRTLFPTANSYRSSYSSSTTAPR
jgi:hypothetical protein